MNNVKESIRDEWPLVSICTCTYNGERIIREYFDGIFSQDYPKDKIEMILADGGSTDGTLRIIDEYKKKYPRIISSFHNAEQFSIGKGKGMDQATRRASGEIIVQLDQDNILVQKDWLKNMVTILLENPELSAVQSRLLVPLRGSITDKYINAIGIEDPFAVNYSLNAQISLNPSRFRYNKKGKFFVYQVNKDKFYYAGDNGFVIRKKDFIESGGYTQDIDNFYRMAQSTRKYNIAVPLNVKLHHKTSTDFKHMLEKRTYYIGHYLLKNIAARDFYWISSRNTLGQNARFILSVLSNLAFLPALVKGIEMSLRQRKAFWLIHPVMVFSITAGYIYQFFYSKFLGERKSTSI